MTSNLLERARVEEKNYNWRRAAEIYEEVAKKFLDQNKIQKAAKYYKMLGFVNSRAADTVDTPEEYKKTINITIKSYETAKDFFKQANNKAEILECKAETYFYHGIIADSLKEGKEDTHRAYDLFIESSELFSKNNDINSVARCLSRAVWSCWYLSNFCTEKTEIENIYQKGIEAVEKVQTISDNIEVKKMFIDTLVPQAWLFFNSLFFIEDFKWDEKWSVIAKKQLKKWSSYLELIQGNFDSRLNGIIYYTAGRANSSYAIYYIEDLEDAIEQEKLGGKGIELMEKGLNLIKKTGDKLLISLCIWSINNHSIQLRRFKYVQKRLLRDLPDIEEAAKIYKNSLNIPFFFSNFLPALYYTNLAQRSFLKPTDQIKYAELGIRHAKESLKTFTFLPHYAWSYQALTWSCSQLVNLAEYREEREKYAEKMLDYSKKADNIAKNYNGGFVVAAGCSSRYKAYKTLADVSLNLDKKEKMFSLAIDAHKDYIGNLIESPTGIIAAQIRLGFLYQELGISTGKIDALEQAKESFLIVVDESSKKGFSFYTAAAYEYLAHVEDRLGNHLASTKYYKNAQEKYQNSLQNIEFKELEEKVVDKINYLQAWSLIEKAKSYHNKEEHIQAKNCYIEAHDILRNSQNYNYEASYHYAWGILEEAEELSKQEKYDESIKSYETSRDLFENSIMMIRYISRNVKFSERERIKRLEKVAELRINHCTARIILEEARVLGIKGEHIAAAEKFAQAAFQFKNVCTLFKIKRKQQEIEAVYYLCRAWENMELAEKYEDSAKFAKAAYLFTKANNLFTESKMKLLASGNSAFCQALEQGIVFDKETDTKIRVELYSKIKSKLRNATSSYQKGGYQGGADWALATSTYFDAAWHLLRADDELNFEDKRDFLKMGSELLKSAAELFGKAGYRSKENEIIEKLKMVEREEKIVVSALNTIREPSLSRSTVGIVAPTCPVETSQSTSISEALEFTNEASRVKRKSRLNALGEKFRKLVQREEKPKLEGEIRHVELKKPVKTIKPEKLLKSPEIEISEKERLELKKIESEVDIEERKFVCIVHKGVIHGAVYICPNCSTFYCIKCATALKNIEEKCWYCDFQFEI